MTPTNSKPSEESVKEATYFFIGETDHEVELYYLPVRDQAIIVRVAQALDKYKGEIKELEKIAYQRTVTPSERDIWIAQDKVRKPLEAEVSLLKAEIEDLKKCLKAYEILTGGNTNDVRYSANEISALKKEIEGLKGKLSLANNGLKFVISSGYETGSTLQFNDSRKKDYIDWIKEKCKEVLKVSEGRDE